MIIVHPVGITIGKSIIGDNFHVLQNTTIGVKKSGDDTPIIGNNCILCANSLVLGNIRICDNVKIGANSLVLCDIAAPGVYVGSPIRQIE